MPSFMMEYPATGGVTHRCHFGSDTTSPPAGVGGEHNWVSPLVDAPVLNRTTTRTVNGQRRERKLGDDGQRFRLTFEHLPKGSVAGGILAYYGYDGLLAFLQNGPDFGQDTFKLYDHTGASHEVRYVEGVDGPGFALTTNLRAGTLVLEKEVS